MLIENTLVEGNFIVQITGDLNTEIELVDISANGRVIGTATMGGPFNDHACEGFVVINLNSPLVAGHVIAAESSDGSVDFATVLQGTPTNTPRPTNTPPPTDTPTPTPSTTFTPTPTGATVFLDKECDFGPSVQFVVRGFNWPDSEDIFLYWNNQIQASIPAGHGGSFQQTWIVNNVNNATHTVLAQSSNQSATDTLEVPCPNVTPTPTMVPPTQTPSPSDLIIVGDPVLASNPPIIGYQPVSFTLSISNTGDIDVDNLFFIDIYFDPPQSQIKATGIDTAYSAGYTALSGLAARSSRTITITSPTGFRGSDPNPRSVYGMVDSVLQVQEADETNNLSGPISVAVTPGATPTPSPTPDSSTLEIGGAVWALISQWVPQGRANVYLVYVDPNASTKTVVAQTASDLRNGGYLFSNVAPLTNANDYYEVTACLTLDGSDRVGTRTNLVPTYRSAIVYIVNDPAGCPYN